MVLTRKRTLGAPGGLAVAFLACTVSAMAASETQISPVPQSRPTASAGRLAQSPPSGTVNPGQHLFSPAPMTGSSLPAPAAEKPPEQPKPKAAPVAKREPAPPPLPPRPPQPAKPQQHQAAKSPPVRASVPLAVAPSATTSQADLNAVKQAIEAARKGGFSQASGIEKTVGDPVARKLIEWAILRGEDNNADFSRYAAFIAANPGWPGVGLFRRRAEAALWQDRLDHATVRSFFASTKPVTAKGRFALARALQAQGDQNGARHYAREAWQLDELSNDLEKQAYNAFGGMLGTADHKARMDRSFYSEKVDDGLRAAARLDGTQIAIAKARAAVVRKARNAGQLLDAVPANARKDTGYIFSRIQWLRRDDKIAEAAKLMLSAPRDPATIVDSDEWWIERKLIARKLLDAGDPRSAYLIARDAAEPTKGGNRVDHHFTAGWIALRFLNDPAAADTHFARIKQVTVHPAGLARADYWRGRAAEARGNQQQAKAYFEQAAHYSTAYYGQLARARLGLRDIALNALPEPPAAARANLAKLEIVRAAEILYAVGERDLVVPIMAEMADRTRDIDALAVLAGVAARHADARALVLLGRGAVGRGLPFDVHAYPVTGLPRYKPIGPKVEPALAYSIARQESGFHPRAVSRAKALGLMQVTPAACRTIAKKFNVPYSPKRLLDDPVYNMQIGAAELGDLLEDMRGSYILTFVAYNAGRRRVAEWTERYGDPRDPKVDPVDWVERIPFSETRNYVQRVLENLQVYRLRFGGSPKLLIEADLRRGAVAN